LTVDLGWIGIWLLVVGAVVVVLEGAVAALLTVRVARKATELNQRLAGQQAELQADLARLQAALAETQVLWQTYRRLLRWLRHPLTIALMQSIARRRAVSR
jgi:membrane-bound ClpP family serine protease